MRSISCAIISFVLFNMALNFKKEHLIERGFLAFLSLVMLVMAFVFMVCGI